MPKELKYKRGFTLRHHLDEKWDRLDYSFKLKIKAFFFIFIIITDISSVITISNVFMVQYHHHLYVDHHLYHHHR